jgi:predicted DNA-binding transcriptional regulator AlpA
MTAKYCPIERRWIYDRENPKQVHTDTVPQPVQTTKDNWGNAL